MESAGGNELKVNVLIRHPGTGGTFLTKGKIFSKIFTSSLINNANGSVA